MPTAIKKQGASRSCCVAFIRQRCDALDLRGMQQMGCNLGNESINAVGVATTSFERLVLKVVRIPRYDVERIFFNRNLPSLARP